MASIKPETSKAHDLGTEDKKWGTVHTGDLKTETITTTGNVIIGGTLTVTGSSVVAEVQTVSATDPLISLAKDNTSDTFDIGFYGKSVNGGDSKYHGIVRDADDGGKFKVFKDASSEPTNTVGSHSPATVVADLEVPSGSSLKVPQADGVLADYVTAVTLGTAKANKVLTVDGSKNLTGINNIIASGTIQAGNVLISGNAISTSTGGAPSFEDVAITGGSIDGTTIGATTPSSIVSTTFVAKGHVDLGDANTDTLTINAKLDSDVIPLGTVDLGAADAKWAEAHVVAAFVETLTASGNVDLGDASSDLLTVNASIDSDLLPEADGIRSLGSSGNRWAHVHADNITANSLTAGRVVFAGTDGKLVDNADLSFSASTLTATNISVTTNLSAGAFSSSSVDIDGGAIDGVSIATSNITVGSEKTLNVSDGTLTTSAAQKLHILENAASNVNFGDYTVTATTFVGQISTLSAHDTDDLLEGFSNLYYTDERVDDRVSSLLIAGEGLDANYDDAAGTLTLSGEDASDTNKGVASFSSDDFSVTSGAVSIKTLGVSNAQLENSTTTLGTTALTLGSTNTVIAGMHKITANTFSGALEGNADTASALASNFTINVVGDVAGSVSTDGTGTTELSLAIQPNSVTLGTDTTGNYIATLNESGGNSDFVLAQSNQENGAATIALATISGLTASTYGSATQIPVVEVDTRGRVRSISTADVATSLAFEGDSGTDSLALLGGTLTFAGGTGLTSAVANDQVSFALDDTAVTAGTYGAASKSLSLTVDAQGRLTAATHQDISISHDQITDFDAEVKDLAGALVSGANTSNLSTSYNSSTDQLSISVETATASTLGVASFSSDDFDIAAGAVSIKDDAITNAYLANPGFSIEGTTGISLNGATITPQLGDVIKFTANTSNLVITADNFSNTLDFDLASSISATTITVGSAVLDSNDLEKIDGITDGIAAANKALVLDANSSITSGLSSLQASTLTDGIASISGGVASGLTNLTVDNINIDANTIKTTSGDLTLDAASGSLFINYGDNLTIRQNTFDGTGGSVDIEGTLSTDAVRRNVVLKTSNYTFDNSEQPNDHIVLFDATSAGGDLTFTLPAANDSNMTFRECIVKNIGTSNNVTISSTSDIDAVSTTLAPGDILKFVSTTTKWCQI